MRRHWKQVAKQAEKRAFSTDELSGALEAALQKEAKALPLEAVCRAVAPDGQGVLFTPDLSVELDALKREHPGSKVAQTFVTCLLDEESSGSSGSDLVEAAVADTLDECARDHSRAIQEHYYRKNRSPTVAVDRRLASAHRLCDFHGLASRMIAPTGSSASSPSPAKRSGLDDGPQL
ncbi:hypothetical protein [Candidatus Palauibacter sp.]|uniref:hypothetical protein n=1 Tax=Candidatus Palauibacter sp. TaxID=3101350 RepID=UPI003B025D17